MRRWVFALSVFQWAVAAAAAAEVLAGDPLGAERGFAQEDAAEMLGLEEADIDEDEDANEACDGHQRKFDEPALSVREERAAQKRRLGAPAPRNTTPGTCVDTAQGSADCEGVTCRDYTADMCGGHDTVTFKANVMCCACGGGEQRLNSPGATDSGGDTCAWYATKQSLCGCCDDEDFLASNCAECAITGSDGEEESKSVNSELRRFPSKTTAIRRAGYSLKGAIPEGLPKRFPQLAVLDLGANKISGSIPQDLWDLPRLQQLWLQGNRLEGTLTAAAGNAIHLTHVDVSDNNLEGSIPSSTAAWTNITFLSTAKNRMTGKLPRMCSSWVHLRQFDLSYNRFAGSVPECVGDWPAVERVNLESNRLGGSLSQAVGAWTNVCFVSLQQNALAGEIPEAVGNWTEVRNVRLGRNRLSGQLPRSIGRWRSILDVDFGSNDLSGTIPESVASWTKVTSVRLSSAGLEGPIPEAVGAWAKVMFVVINDNGLSGPIPEAVGAWANVQEVVFDSNRLSGPIPEAVGNWTKVETVNLRFNDFSGMIPRAVGGWTSVEEVRLGMNRLTGPLPTEVGNWKNLRVFHLSNVFMSGSLPETAANWARVETVYFSRAGVVIDTEVMGAWRQLRLFWTSWPTRVQHPALSEAVVANWTSLRKVRVDYGNSGALPEAIGRWSRVEQVTLVGFKGGKMPDSIGEWRGLKKAHIRANRLDDCRIPAAVGHWPKVKDVKIMRNADGGACGRIPQEVGMWKDVLSVDFSYGRYEGPVPTSVGQWGKVQEVYLNGNNFSGQVDGALRAMANWSSVRQIDLHDNALSGMVPNEAFVGVWPALQRLDLSSNGLRGFFPSTAGLSALERLSLEANLFDGIGGLPPTLGFLNVSLNNLTELPESTFGLTNLTVLDVKSNHIARWPPRGVWALKAPGVVCGSVLMAPRFGLAKLEFLDASGNPLGSFVELSSVGYSSVRVFMDSLAYLHQLQEVRCRGCRLSGVLPRVGSGISRRFSSDVVQASSGCQLREGLSRLQKLDLAENRITAVNNKPGLSLVTADLSNNALQHLDRSWFNENGEAGLVLLKLFGNPGLHTSVAISSRMCPPAGSDGLAANLYGYTPVASRGYEQTTLCSGLRTRYTVDDTLNVSALCRCLPGHAGQGNACTPCPQDTYSIGLDEFNLVRECRRCPDRSRTEGPNSTEVFQCICPAGLHFAAVLANSSVEDRSNGTAISPKSYQCARCSQWPLRTTLAPGANSEKQCACNTSYVGLKAKGEVCGCEDYYYMNHAELRCTRCSQAEFCQWGADLEASVVPPRVKPGYWVEAAPLDITKFEGNVVWRCVGKGACTQDGCADGRVGRACSLCAAGTYGAPDGPCKRCPSSPDTQRWVLGLGALAMVPIPVIIHCVLAVNSEERGALLALRSFRISMKQTVKHLQTIAVVSGFNVDWPPLAKNAFEAVNKFTVDLPSWSGAACLRPQTSAALEVGFNLCVPVVFVIVTLIAMPFSWAASKVLARTLRQSILRRLPVPPDHMELSLWDAVRVLLFTGLLFFSTLLKNTMAALTCIPSPMKNKAMTVSTYPHLECSLADHAWLSLAIASGVAFLVYVGGIIVAVFLAWIGATNHMAESNLSDRGWFSFLFDDFRCGCMRWPLLLMAKEIAFVLIGVVLPGQGAVQLLGSAAIALGMLVRVAADSPYQDKSNTVMEAWNLGSVALICFYSCGMGYQSTPGVGDIVDLFSDGDSDPVYRARAIGMVIVQVVAMLGPFTIITYQLLCATHFTIRCVPHSLRPSTQEETSEWIQHFTTTLGVPRLLTTIIERFDDIDFGRFRSIFETSPAVIGLYETSTRASWERRRLSGHGGHSLDHSATPSPAASSAVEPDAAKNETGASGKSEDQDLRRLDGQEMRGMVQDQSGGPKATYEDLVQQVEKLQAEIVQLKGSAMASQGQKDGFEEGVSLPALRASL